MFYRWIRDLHLYFGLFISPFILLFSASVFFLNHAKVAIDRPTSVETFHDLTIPEDLETTSGPAAIIGAKQILQQVRGTGEIGFTRFVGKSRHFVFPVSKPGLEMTVDVDLDGHSASVSRRETTVWEALGYLHKMPGPHNAAIRGNWIATRLWRWFADVTIYLTMFISLSGIYLWWVLKAERRIGFTLLGLGAVTFFGLIYAVIA